MECLSLQPQTLLLAKVQARKETQTDVWHSFYERNIFFSVPTLTLMGVMQGSERLSPPMINLKCLHSLNESGTTYN